MHTKQLEYTRKLRFKLVKGARKDREGNDTYRAVMRRGEGIDLLTGEDKLMEQFGFNTSALRQAVKSLVEQMVEGALKDGRTRRFGDLFEVRLDIEGKFSRIDEPFDPEKHKLKVNLVPLKGLSKAFKRVGNYPENERKQPRGKIDYVTFPGGEKGEIRQGEDIIVYGDNLKLRQGNWLAMQLKGAMGDKVMYGIYPEYRDLIVENTQERLWVKWFGPKAPGSIKAGTRAKLFLRGPDEGGEYHPIGSSSEVLVR